MKNTLQLSAIALALAALAGCQAPSHTASSTAAATDTDTLLAAKVAQAPNLAALDADPAWAIAKALKIELSGGKNFANGKGMTDAYLKAVYTDDTLYMLVQYADPTNSVRRGPYQKQADGSWKKLSDPANKGGDDNVYYEDKWAFLWPNAELEPLFVKQGCAVMCHEGEGKPYGNKYTLQEGQIADMWHMKGSRTAPWGLVDDQYTDHTRYDPKTSPNAGRKGDPGTQGGDYTGIKLADGKPEFMHRDGKPANAGGTYYIKNGDQVAFDGSRFKAGDEVASYIANELKGDRADVKLAHQWRDGKIISVLSRKLVTGSKYDVQFSDLNKRYAFGFAAFDNAQVRHASADDTNFLVFVK
jgi:hypothetical protein